MHSFFASLVAGVATSKTTTSLRALCRLGRLGRGVLLNESREHGASARRLGLGLGLRLGLGLGLGRRLRLRLRPMPCNLGVGGCLV